MNFQNPAQQKLETALNHVRHLHASGQITKEEATLRGAKIFVAYTKEGIELHRRQSQATLTGLESEKLAEMQQADRNVRAREAITRRYRQHRAEAKSDYLILYYRLEHQWLSVAPPLWMATAAERWGMPWALPAMIIYFTWGTIRSVWNKVCFEFHSARRRWNQRKSKTTEKSNPVPFSEN